MAPAVASSLTSTPQRSPIPRVAITFGSPSIYFSRYSLTISPLRLVSASMLLSSMNSSPAFAATIESWIPRNVPECSPGFQRSYSGLNIASPIGNGYPPIDFESENISGLIPALSNEKNVPVLAQPTCTSSTTIRISFLSQNSRSALRYSTENTFTPPSACTVSIKIAAGFSTPE